MVKVLLKKIGSVLFPIEAEAAQPVARRSAPRPHTVAGPAPALEPHGVTETAGNEDSVAERGVEQRLQALVTATPTKLVAGRVQLLGLAEIKAALGARWDRHGEIIFDLIERSIQKRLAPTDVYQRDLDGNFTICFAELSESEAAFKARAIADEIRAKILGRDWHSGTVPLTTEVTAFLDEVAGGAGQQQSLVVHGDAHEIELGVEEVAQSDDLLGLLTSRLEAAADRSRQAEQGTVMEIANHSGLELHPVETYRGEIAPFRFATFDKATREKVAALRSRRPSSEVLVRDLDVLLLSKVAEEILAQPPGKSTVLIVNIHFSTIDGKRRLEHFRKLCCTLTDTARAALVFNIVEVPAGLLPAKVAEQFHQIRHFCRAMMVECAALTLGNIDPQMLRTPVLTFKAEKIAMEIARDASAASMFLKELRLKRLRVLVYGPATARQRGQLKALGVEFLALD